MAFFFAVVAKNDVVGALVVRERRRFERRFDDDEASYQHE